MTTRRPTPPDPLPERSDPGDDWRWRNYAERLISLGYDLDGGAIGVKGSTPRPINGDRPDSATARP